MADKIIKGRGKGFPSGNVKYSRANSIDALNTVDVLPNPDPILRIAGVTFEQYTELLNDPHLVAVITSRKAVTTSKSWSIVKNDSPDNVMKFVEKAFKQFDVNRSTREILDSFLWGYQPMEPVWGKAGFEGESKIWPIEFNGRPVFWFQYDRENKLRFRTKENIWPGEHIKPFTLLVPRYEPKYENPYGKSLLSVVYWTVNFKKGGFKFWVEFSEKYGQPFLQGKSPRSVGDPEFNAFHEALLEMVRGSVITTPNDSDIEVIQAGQKSNADIFKELLEFCNAEISKAIIGQTLTTEAGKNGARALGEVHNTVKQDIAESDEIMCEMCFNQLIKWIGILNFGENVEVPEFKYDHEEDIKKDLAERDAILNTAGVKFTSEYYQKTYNLDPKDFELVEVSDGDNLDLDIEDDTDPDSDKDFAEKLSSVFKDQEALDAYINSLSSAELQSQADFVKPIINLVKNSKSFEEVQEGVLDLFQKVRPEQLEKELGRALLATQSVGAGGAD